MENVGNSDDVVPELLLPPRDANLRKRLEAKLKEYETRRIGKGEPWEMMHPELAHLTQTSYRDSCYKIDVLSAVLSAEAGKPVKTWELSRELAERYGPAFDVNLFSNACGVIANYLGITSFEMTGGTGLPEVEDVEK